MTPKWGISTCTRYQVPPEPPAPRVANPTKLDVYHFIREHGPCKVLQVAQACGFPTVPNTRDKAWGKLGKCLRSLRQGGWISMTDEEETLDRTVEVLI